MTEIVIFLILLLAVNNLILNFFLFLLIIFNVEVPIEPVDPSIIIFLSILKIHYKPTKNNPIGVANKIPSTLSNKPPCPGNIEPASFNLAFLFK